MIHLATDKFSEKETAAVQRLQDSVQAENRTVWTSTYNGPTKEVLTLTGHDLSLVLYQGNWLNNEIVNFYLNLVRLDNMCRISHRECDSGRDGTVVEGKGCIPITTIFSSFFFTKLFNDDMQYQYSAVQKWMTDIDVGDVDLIIASFHVRNSNHWTLVVADLRRQNMEYYDSLTPDKELARKVTDGFARFLLERSVEQGKVVNTKYFNYIWNVPGIPRQRDINECGVFMLTYASLLAGGFFPPYNFSFDDIHSIRGRIALDVLVTPK